MNEKRDWKFWVVNIFAFVLWVSPIVLLFSAFFIFVGAQANLEAYSRTSYSCLGFDDLKQRNECIKEVDSYFGYGNSWVEKQSARGLAGNG